MLLARSSGVQPYMAYDKYRVNFHLCVTLSNHFFLEACSRFASGLDSPRQARGGQRPQQ
jgi:hypothetical protein